MSDRNPSPEAIAALKETASLLHSDQIFDLCYSFAADPVRLRVYLDVLRAKSGTRAQAASCLICFDLAQKGDPHFEREFMALLPVLIDLRARLFDGEDVMRALVGDNEYLADLWASLIRVIDRSDPRKQIDIEEAFQSEEVEVAEIPLISDSDFEEIEDDVFNELFFNREVFAANWQRALNDFYSVEGGVRMMVNRSGTTVSLGGGFSADSKGDLQRIERLHDESLSLSGHVRDARELLPLTELFLAAHTRAKNIFGRRNRRRDIALTEGIAHFSSLAEAPTQMCCWLLPPTAPVHAFEKIAEILLDYLSFMATMPTDEVPLMDFDMEMARRYVESDRPQPAPPVLLNHGAGMRRR